MSGGWFAPLSAWLANQWCRRSALIMKWLRDYLEQQTDVLLPFPQPAQLRVQQSIAGMYGLGLFVSLFQSLPPIKHRGEKNRSGFREEAMFLCSPLWWDWGSRVAMSVLPSSFLEVNILPVSVKVLKIGFWVTQLNGSFGRILHLVISN